MSGELVKALLFELEQPKDQPARVKPSGQHAKVQFNPETLKVSYSNSVLQPKNAGNQQEGTAARQFVGSGTTKLSLELWFDVTVLPPSEHVDDVRRLTAAVSYFMTPQASDAEGNLAPPLLRFAWGSFVFDGVVDSIEESLELFSAAGQPLRARVSLAMSQQKILASGPAVRAPAGVPGTRPLFEAKAGQSLPAAAAQAGQPDWQSIARANGIEDPRRLAPGQLLDFAARLPGDR